MDNHRDFEGLIPLLVVIVIVLAVWTVVVVRDDVSRPPDWSRPAPASGGSGSSDGPQPRRR